MKTNTIISACFFVASLSSSCLAFSSIQIPNYPEDNLLTANNGITTDCTYSTDSGTGSGVGAFREFGFSFDSKAFTNKTGTIDSNTSLSLQSISITGAKGSTGTSGKFYLLVYEGKGAPTALTNICGCSTGFIDYTVGKTDVFTFNFKDLLLDSSKNYSFVFSTSNSAQEGLTGYNAGIRMYTSTQDDGKSWAQGGGNGNGITTNKIPTGLSVNFLVVPEPTTATFGLLSLGLLALRRRRY